MRPVWFVTIMTLCGCGQRIASPNFQRAPQITCIVIVENPQLAETAIQACRDAIQGKEKRQWANNE